jgi:hypothetical protein
VTITPVQGPLPGRLGVAQPGDRELRLLRAHVLMPGWPALHDRQIPRRHIALQLDLAPGMFRDALLAPAPDPRHIRLTRLRIHDIMLWGELSGDRPIMESLGRQFLGLL